MTTRTAKRRRRLAGVAALCALAVAAAVVLFRQYQQEWATTPLVVSEGHRAAQVYEAADEALSVSAGTTKKAAERAARAGKLKLPAAAKGNPEGYLYPGTYTVRSETTPTSLVASMTKTARKRHAAAHVDDYPTLVVASIAQAEADNYTDMTKVVRVIKNRMARDMPLQMDSTINYALGRSTLNTSLADTRIESPYNTYRHKGLPPSPINNPGREALKAATSPADGDWLYFVTVKPGDTRFTDDYEQHLKWVEEFNAEQRNGT
ncbi:endolytic transglycosylase MltG [Streptomyces tubbatahanensis]|uniref:Endolytic transglycosylase MltG n=1 Tax=Streptomyces tubbatahanensis TaxID=2923272 RepID=A0ABY3XTE4_9ACTN|nr:endolytic transglycosylase MltG [Streptomyces tubbatahanensis]UNS97660.1 endolytic transglycosylase MltG [Streptomyces tubbatahanensis]